MNKEMAISILQNRKRYSRAVVLRAFEFILYNN